MAYRIVEIPRSSGTGIFHVREGEDLAAALYWGDFDPPRELAHKLAESICQTLNTVQLITECRDHLARQGDLRVRCEALLIGVGA